MSPRNSAPDGSEIFSDESSFYGDDNEQARLEDEVKAYDPEPYWSYYHPKLLAQIQKETREAEEALNSTSSTLPTEEGNESSTRLYPHKRGVNESISAFLFRLRPSIALESESGPWIWVRGKASKSLSKSLESRDEASFVKKGTELLREFDEKEQELCAAHDKSVARSTAGLTRKLKPLRGELEVGILSLARETGITAGKWMLFPSDDRVDTVWRTLVLALEKGDVCADAKVSTDDGKGTGQARLICIYTEDFADREDVKKVLQMLAREELFDPRGRPIYYKSDAFTLLEINSKNKYQLKASMYSSKDFQV
ncbi:uncharacterized protein N7483_007236 [Penicillium malachiteum]|uniref:uncharacterized protein n=1 Tax=Penicillium malachiteum TaxID=1324776 RepID=UPI0025479120|nr:uncharacterized protein N7483_007236 [Penicillium malachiteum]KAJ5725879.1 hypothetical protein N7483_007236 [Penicillium malachiteum]